MRKAVERHAPMRIISLSVSPAKASVDTRPIRNDLVDMQVESIPRLTTIFFNCRDSWEAFSIQSSDGIAKNGQRGLGRAL